MNISHQALSIQEQTELERIEALMEIDKEAIKSHWLSFAERLDSIKIRKLYRSYGTYDDYCKNRWGLTPRSVNRLIDGLSVINNLKSGPIGPLPQVESQARPLAQLEPEIQREAWREVVNRNGDNITAAKVQEVVEEWKPVNEQVKQAKERPMFSQPVESIIDEAKEARPHVSNNSGEDEWYTPAEYIEAARAAMGSIDLDPASSELANQVVKAAKIYTEQDDGLRHAWKGNIWLNPPYKQPEISQFCEKVITENANGWVIQAIVLVNNATETAAGQMLLSSCDAVCFPKGRIKYYYPGRPSKTPLQGQMIVYFGLNEDSFIEHFKNFGVCTKMI